MAKAKKLPSGSWRVQVFVGLDENGKKMIDDKINNFLTALFELHTKIHIELKITDLINVFRDLQRVRFPSSPPNKKSHCNLKNRL